MSAKESVKELIEKLPDDAKYEDIIAEIYFKQRVEEGFEQIEQGKYITHDEVMKRLDKWLK